MAKRGRKSAAELLTPPPIRDDGRVFASKLALAGVDVTYREARGMIHGFMRARFKGKAARREYDLICDFLRANLHEA